MSTPRFSVALENGRYVKVQTWKEELRVDLREWEIHQPFLKPTKKGISLKLLSFKTLIDTLDLIEATLKENVDGKWHLGFNVYVTVKKDNPCIDVRQYWKPSCESGLVPTKKGLCLRPLEY
ncbi:uncharacterized protein LOC133179562 [Saccostrea echinata]|uniref:uncharacterized protein LOC133179562 n=1 Tax=Saccostrea echinata TaxID=191078 RepID=UPI002A80E64B|nr:uncharacterized protein LOC133179562 [Saccostrea echinata]